MRPSALLARLALVPILGLLTASAPPLKFIPLAGQDLAAAEYRALWEAEGPRIVAALEAETGLVFPSRAIDVIVTDGPPMTSYDGRTIRLRGRYAPLYKRATLVHELGHLLAFSLPDRGGLDDHRLLYLYLYDVWTELYGKTFADRMVQVEKRIEGPADYRAAWDWALAQSRAQRRARLAALRGPPRLGYEDVLKEPEPQRPPRPRTLDPDRPAGEVDGMR